MSTEITKTEEVEERKPFVTAVEDILALPAKKYLGVIGLPTALLSGYLDDSCVRLSAIMLGERLERSWGAINKATTHRVKRSSMSFDTKEHAIQTMDSILKGTIVTELDPRINEPSDVKYINL